MAEVQEMVECHLLNVARVWSWMGAVSQNGLHYWAAAWVFAWTGVYFAFGRRDRFEYFSHDGYEFNGYIDYSPLANGFVVDCDLGLILELCIRN